MLQGDTVEKKTSTSTTANFVAILILGCFAFFAIPVLGQLLGIIPRPTPAPQPTAAAVVATDAPRDTATPEASATITDTPEPSATATGVRPTANPLQEPLREIYEDIEGIASVGLVSVRQNDERFDVYTEVIVDEGYNTEETADALREATYPVVASAFVEFATIIDDGSTATSYTWSNQTDDWDITPLTMVVRPTATP